MLALHRELRAMEQRRRIQVVLRMSTMTLICEMQMNNRRMLGSFRAIFNDKITRYSESLDGSYLLSAKVNKLVFPKWQLPTGLDVAVDPSSTDTINIAFVGKGGRRSINVQLAWLTETVEYDKWADEIGYILDYSEHTTMTTTEERAAPWLSMRNARILSTGDPSMGW